MTPPPSPDPATPARAGVRGRGWTGEQPARGPATRPRRPWDGAAGLVPPGTLPVGAGLAVLGVGSYATIAVAGHTLDAPGMAALAVLWTIVYLASVGLFLPVEQELISHVAARRASGQGIAPAVGRTVALAGVICAAALVPLAIAARPLAGHLFGGRESMVAALAAAVLAAGIGAVNRGVLAGMGRFAAYGGQLAADGGLRVLLACALAAAGSHSALALALTMTAAPLLAAAGTLGLVLRDLHPGPPLPWLLIAPRLGMLTGTMLLSQVVAYAAVVDVRLLAPGDPAVVGSVLSAMVLARVPLFVFASLQAALLPGLASAIARDEQARFRQLLARSCGAVALLAAGAGIPSVILGPWLARVLFAVRPAPGRAEFAMLAAGTGCFMLAMVLGQGAMVLSRHRAQLLAWLAGTLLLAAITLGPGPVRFRVEAGYAVSSAAVACVLALVLRAALTSSRYGAPRTAGYRRPRGAHRDRRPPSP